MGGLRLVAASAVLVIAGCADGRSAADPTAPALAVQSPARQVGASGHYDALVDFSTLALTPRGQNCLLEVEGRLVFTGTIEGTATGRTSALVLAPCGDVATTPPGTFRDVFRSELAFEGTVDGDPVEASVLYLGRVEPGGLIPGGRLVFSGDARGTLDADGRVAVGGEYSGSLVVQ